MRDLTTVANRVNNARAALHDSQRRYLGSLWARRLSQLRNTLLSARKRATVAILGFRSLIDAMFPRLAAALLIGFLVVMLYFVVSMLLPANVARFLIGGAVVVAASFLLLGHWLLVPGDEFLLRQLGNLECRANASRDAVSQKLRGEAEAVTIVRLAENELNDARTEYHFVAAAIEAERLANDRDYQRNLLLRMNWQGLTAGEFEQFLESVFVLNGFRVRRTGKTGDQGIDLIAERNALKLAIQAKGYPGTTVSNSAVQEAHTGRAHYRCDVAVVITNSLFTRSAKELAASVGCVLVDRESFQSLVLDRFQWPQRV